ncbi:MAG: hypothetical protein M3P08_17265 [Thermoproteota archaeon]|nr:hypothetical protein [Thermoproteota archaeon]
MMFRASFGIVLSFGAVLFTIWPNILPLQQHLAMAQIIPGAARAPTFGSVPANTTAGAPANTTAGAPANTTAGAPANTTAAEAPDPGDPAGEEAVPHWYGGAPCSDNSCHD